MTSAKVINGELVGILKTALIGAADTSASDNGDTITIKFPRSALVPHQGDVTPEMEKQVADWQGNVRAAVTGAVTDIAIEKFTTKGNKAASVAGTIETGGRTHEVLVQSAASCNTFVDGKPTTVTKPKITISESTNGSYGRELKAVRKEYEATLVTALSAIGSK